MQLILSIGIRFVLYVMIAFPLLKGIFSFSGNVGSTIIAVILVLILASVLEMRGIVNKIIAYVSNLIGWQIKTNSNTAATSAIASLNIGQSYAECPNCGSQIALIGGKGKCPSCDTPLSQN